MAGRGRALTMPAWMTKQMQQQGGAAPPPPPQQQQYQPAAVAAPVQPPMAAYRQQPPQYAQPQYAQPQYAQPQQPQYAQHQAYPQPAAVPPQSLQQQQPALQYVPMHLQAPSAPAAAIKVPPQFADAPDPAVRDVRVLSERNGSSSASKHESSAHREEPVPSTSASHRDERTSSRRSRSRESRKDRSSRDRSSSRRRSSKSRTSRSSRSSKADRSRSPRADRSRSRERRSSRSSRSTRDERGDRSERSSHRSSHRSSRHRASRSRSRSPKIVRRRKTSQFDVLPPGVTPETAAAYAAQTILQQSLAALAKGPVPATAFAPPPSTAGTSSHQQHAGGNAFAPGHYNAPSRQPAQSSNLSQQTRHARRLYVGGIDEVTESDVTDFFNDVIDRALGERQDGGAVVSVYINRERHFAFVELQSIELTTACMTLDGVAFRGQPLKIRRPNDYNPAGVPLDVGPIPQLNLAALGIVSTTVVDGPGKVFIGGLPYHLNEEQVKELLQAFGPLRSFHLVKELSSNLSKGYGFCEYMEDANKDDAVAGLNNMQLGDKTLTVRLAMGNEHKAGMGGGSDFGNGPMMMPGGMLLPPPPPPMHHLGSGLAPIIGTPSRVVVLLNMVTPDELEDEEEFTDIVDDIKTECERFGRVVSIAVPRPRDGGVASAVGKVFVEFDAVASAQSAANDLHGRGFANRTVAVEFMDEDTYARREFA